MDSGRPDVLIAVFACVLCFIIAVVKIYTKNDASRGGGGDREVKQRAGNSNGNSAKKRNESSITACILAYDCRWSDSFAVRTRAWANVTVTSLSTYRTHVFADAHGEKPKEKPKSNQPKTKKQPEKDKEKEVKDPWLFTTLKGHTGIINSMDYSTNGKYLATCAGGKIILIFFYCASAKQLSFFQNYNSA